MWVMTSNTIERLAIMDEIRMAREQWETMANNNGKQWRKRLAMNRHFAAVPSRKKRPGCPHARA
jgi:hypothetical protein